MQSTRRHFLFGALAAPVWAQKKRAAAPERPSILLITAHDLGAWMLGCYGNQEIHTPNLDRLAQTGMRFLNHLVCTPSPASLATMLTGRTSRQIGAAQTLGSEVTISDILGGQDYNCGYAGAWWLDNDPKPQHGFKFWETGAGREQATAKAGQFLDQQSSAKPFFLTVAFGNSPAEDIPQKYTQMYAGVRFETIGYSPMAANAAGNREMFKDFLGNLRKAAAATSALDEQVALLVDKVRARGLLEHTVIVFTADCGMLLGQHGLWGGAAASEPVNLYEEVVRTPMIWSWLGHVPPTNTRPELISAYDLLPTFCELTGVPAPEARKLGGRSYLPLAFDRKLPKKQPWRSLVFAQYRNTEMARDTRYKLVLRDEGKSRSEFYDLAVDARERTSQYDNPQYVDMRDRLFAEVADWRKRQ